jgi:hypothetical protein
MNNGKDKKTLPCKKFHNCDSVFMNEMRDDGTEREQQVIK